MNVRTILFIVIILVLLYVVIRYISKDSGTLTSSIMAGTTQQQISAANLGTSSSGNNNSNFTYSIWFYIDDWNYMYNQPKVLFGRMGSATASSTTGVSGSDPCPLVTFGAIENNLSIALTVAAGSDAASSGDPAGSSPNTVVHTCKIGNIPIQAWTNLLVSVYGRTMDIYLDGKLVNTCVLPGIAMVNSNADLYITPKGGFSGWTSKLQYFPNSTDPQTAWNIYQKGYGANFLSNMFGSYQVKVSFLENGNESNSFTV